VPGRAREVDVSRLIECPPLAPVVFVERKVLLRLGYRKGATEAAPAVRSLVREETERAKALVRPRVAAAVLEKAELPDHPVFGGAEKAALCVCTIGPELESAAAGLIAEGELLRGLVLDWLGSEAVTNISRQAGRWLAGMARAEGLLPGKMFAPGYKGWDVTGQEFIFATVPASAIGVRLTPSSMMVPRKSYSFRINCHKGRDPAVRKDL
jgi:hypothetical protein